MSLQSILARVKLWDGTNQASVTASNALKVDGSAVTQPISVASLPSHAVTNAGTFAVQAAQSGTWTVQPGNTANTTAWKVDGSAVTQPVSGTVTANAGSGTMTVSDQHSNNTADYDTGAGTQTMTMYGMALPASGGSVAGGTAANPVRTDPTGTTTQPVSGTFWQATQPVSGTFWQTTQPVSLASGATAIAKAEDVASADADVGVPAMAIRKATPANTSGTDGDYEMLQISAGRLWASATIDAALPAGSNAIGGVTQSGTWTVQPGNTANTTAWKVDASSVAVPVTDNSGSLTVDGSVTAVTDKSATATLSNVASSATSVTLLASNSSRKGATIYNDSTQNLYVKFGTTASSTSFTILMAPNSYYEVPFQHTGRIDGIWAAANGNARVTEFT